MVTTRVMCIYPYEIRVRSITIGDNMPVSETKDYPKQAVGGSIYDPQAHVRLPFMVDQVGKGPPTGGLDVNVLGH
jgi:hypothetical protein